MSLKSWKTTPSVRRKYGTWESGSTPMFRPLTRTCPEVGSSSRKSSFRSVDFPAPEGPVRNTNSPRSTLNDTSEIACRKGP